MEEKHFPTILTIGVFLVLLLLSVPSCLPEPHQESSLPQDGSLLREGIDFNISSVESFILHPEEVLEDLDAFIDEDRAYRVVKLWCRYQNQRFHADECKQELIALAAVPPAKRGNHPAMKLARELMGKKQTFLKEAVPHIRSFLPGPDVELSTTIHFAIGPIETGFVADNYPVVNISHPYWRGSASTILNGMTHELFHIFYGRISYLKKESDLVIPGLDRIPEKLQNEGMATYVAYKATRFFPAPADRDYKLLENMSTVRELLKKLNVLFKKAESTPYDKIRSELWDVGVEQRGYYVVGAFMARTIDEKSGRTALVETISTGSRAFLDTYNNLVEEDMRIYKFKVGEDRSIYEKLRRAALEKDYKTCKILFSEIRKLKPGTEDRIPFKLYRVGHVLMLRDESDLAIELWDLFLELYPKSGDAFNALGMIYLKQGKRELALKQFKKALKVQPENLHAFEMLRRGE